MKIIFFSVVFLTKTSLNVAHHEYSINATFLSLYKMLKILEHLPCWCFPAHALVNERS